MGTQNSEVVSSFAKAKKDGGDRQQILEECVTVHADIKPDPKYRKSIVSKKSYADKAIQAIPAMVLTEMNTMRAAFSDATFMHTEGGWPKDVIITEQESVMRYRKKLEKEESFQAAVPALAETMEDLIKNNNTINFYRKGYKSTPVSAEKDLVPSATVVNVYKNPISEPRRASRISFAPDNAGKMLVAQAPFEYDPALRESTGEAYFWDVENPSTPEGVCQAGSHIMDARYNPKDLYIICGALFSGQVAIWDTRVGPIQQSISSYDVSHHDVCSCALWVNSKTGTEFFSCGLDGQVIWWDQRNLSETLDTLWCDPEKGQCRPENAIGGTVLEYESTLPTKFLCGTEEGHIMVFVRKGKASNERLSHLYKAHRGPVKACHRNPIFIKNFLSVGDYQLRITAEDCRESSIMWTIPSESMYFDASWIHSRPSSFVASRADGVLEWWDLLVHGATNILQFEVCDQPLTSICCADGGKHIAVGTMMGDVKFVKMTDFMGEFEKNDKPALAAVFDRESRREKYLEQRNREIRLKKRDADKKEAEMKKLAEENAAEREASGLVDTSGLDPLEAHRVRIRHEVRNNPLILAEREFFASIKQEIISKGLDAFPGKHKPIKEEAPENGNADSDASR